MRMDHSISESADERFLSISTLPGASALSLTPRLLLARVGRSWLELIAVEVEGRAETVDPSTLQDDKLSGPGHDLLCKAPGGFSPS